MTPEQVSESLRTYGSVWFRHMEFATFDVEHTAVTDELLMVATFRGDDGWVWQCSDSIPFDLAVHRPEKAKIRVQKLVQKFFDDLGDLLPPASQQELDALSEEARQLNKRRT